MTEAELEVIRNLRTRGFAVIVWTPEELNGADPTRFEDRSIELGWDVIDALAGENE